MSPTQDRTSGRRPAGRPAPTPTHRRWAPIAALAALTLGALAAGASEVRVLAKPVDFAADGTGDGTPLPDDHPIPGDPEVHEIIRAEAERVLAARGLARTTENPDLLVSYTGYITDKLTIEGVEREIVPGVSWIGHPDAHEMWGYKEGTLVIEIHDPASREIVWSGWASAAGPTVEKLRRKAGKVTRKILRNFPPSE